MDQKTTVLLLIKDSEKRAHALIQEALAKKEQLVKQARGKAQSLETEDMDALLKTHQQRLNRASQTPVKVDTKQATLLRRRGEKRIEAAATHVWKEVTKVLG